MISFKPIDIKITHENVKNENLMRSEAEIKLLTSWQEFNSAKYCHSAKKSGSQRLTVISKQTVTIYIICNIII